MNHRRTHTENLQIIYEDNHLIIVNKRVGDLVQGDKTGDKPLSDIVKTYIKKKYKKPGDVFLGVVHRIDRPTSGAVIFARTSKALTRLNKALQEKQIKKTYWAIIQGKPDSKANTLVHYLVKNQKKNKSFIQKSNNNGAKKAILHYKIRQYFDNYTLVEIDLETGRHHQIRVQMAAIGHPVKGDLKYGASRSNDNGGIHLHAKYIHFMHPVKKELLEINAPLPNDKIWNLCTK